MSTSLRKQAAEAGGPQWRLLPGGKPHRHTELGRALVWILVLATAFRLWMALYGSQGIVAEDTYSVLRQARNWLDSGRYALQGAGQADPSAPLTLFGLLLTPIQAWLGTGTTLFLLAFNTVLWTAAVLAVLRPLRPSVRPTVALLLCLAPAIVDGAVRGTDAEWLGFLLAMSFASISVGRTAWSLTWFSLAVLSAPSMVFFAPVWIGVHAGRMGPSCATRTLLRWRNGLALLATFGVWGLISSQVTGFSLWDPFVRWAGELGSPWSSFGELWRGLASFTLLPWVGKLPAGLQHLAAAATAALIVATVVANFRSGTAASRGWLAFYLLMLAFGSGVSGPALDPAASILPALAFTLAMVPLLLPMVPRFHETRILKGTAIVLLTLAMPIAFGRSLDRRSVAHDLESAAQDLEALHPELLDTPIWTSQAGHFAYLHAGPVLDPVRQAQGLPEEERVLTRLVQTAGPILLLISEQELAENRFAGLTSVWTTEADHDWWNEHTTRVERYGDWHLIAAKP